MFLVAILDDEGFLIDFLGPLDYDVIRAACS